MSKVIGYLEKLPDDMDVDEKLINEWEIKTNLTVNERPVKMKAVKWDNKNKIITVHFDAPINFFEAEKIFDIPNMIFE